MTTETPFWDRYFEVFDLLVGAENGYARPTASTQSPRPLPDTASADRDLG